MMDSTSALRLARNSAFAMVAKLVRRLAVAWDDELVRSLVETMGSELVFLMEMMLEQMRVS